MNLPPSTFHPQQGVSLLHERVVTGGGEVTNSDVSNTSVSECPRCREYDAIPFGEPGERAAWKALGRSFAVHTCEMGD